VRGADEAGEGGVGPQGAGEGVGVDASEAVDGHRGGDGTVALERRDRLQHARVLDRRVDDVPPGAGPSAGRPEHPEVRGERPGRGEVHLVGARPEHGRDGLAGAVEQQSRPPAGAVEAVRIGPAVVERGEQRRARGGVQGESGGCVEVAAGGVHVGRR
jgi:hypothetical protein